MTITFPDTNPDIIKIERGRTYYVSANAGDLTIKRKALNGSYIEVEGSPVTDGQEQTQVLMLLSPVFTAKLAFF